MVWIERQRVNPESRWKGLRPKYRQLAGPAYVHHVAQSAIGQRVSNVQLPCSPPINCGVVLKLRREAGARPSGRGAGGRGRMRRMWGGGGVGAARRSVNIRW